VSKAGPTEAEQRRDRTARRGSRGGRSVSQDIVTPEPEPAPGETGRRERPGILASWQEFARTLTGTSQDLVTGANLRSLPFIDRLQRAVNIINPTNVPLYSRPWFIPLVLAGAIYIGNDYYKKRQAKPAAGEKKGATAASPAAAARAAMPAGIGPR
jgi:hypothetical protein